MLSFPEDPDDTIYDLLLIVLSLFSSFGNNEIIKK